MTSEELPLMLERGVTVIAGGIDEGIGEATLHSIARAPVLRSQSIANAVASLLAASTQLLLFFVAALGLAIVVTGLYIGLNDVVKG